MAENMDKIVEDVAYIRAKIELIPEIRSKLDEHNKRIGEHGKKLALIQGMLGVISTLCAFIIPTVVRNLLK